MMLRLPVEALSLISAVGGVLLSSVGLIGLVLVAWVAFLSPGATTLRAIGSRQAKLADPSVYKDVMGGRPTPPLRRLALHDGGSLVVARSKAILSVLGAIAICFSLNYSLIALRVPVPVSLLLSLAPFNFVLVKAVKHWRLSAAEVRSVDRRAPVLIMRAFADDKLFVVGEGMDFPMTFPPSDKYRLEQLLAHGLRSYGPSVTIGSPHEPFPLPGAARQYATEESCRGDPAGRTRCPRSASLPACGFARRADAEPVTDRGAAIWVVFTIWPRTSRATPNP